MISLGRALRALVVSAGLLGCSEDQFTTLASDAGPDTSLGSDASDAKSVDANPVEASCDGACEPFVLVADAGTPYGIASAGDRVFWTDHGSEQSADGALNVVAAGGGNTTALMGLLPGPAFLAVDAVNKNVYVASNGSFNSGYNDGSFSMIGFNAVGLKTMGGGLYPHASSMVVHNNVIFWLSSELGGGTADLNLANPSAVLFAAATPFTVAVGTSDVVIAALGDGPSFTSNSHMMRYALDGGTKPELLPPSASRRPRVVTIHNDVAYWTMETDGVVYKRDLTSAAASTTIAAGLISPMGIAVDDTYAYVTCQGTNANPDAGVPQFSGGYVVRIPLATGCIAPACEVLANNQGWPFGITVDDQAVYWVNRSSGQVMALRK